MDKPTFLIDTNVLIPLEPTSPSGLEAGTTSAAEFVRLCLSSRAVIYRHPLMSVDLGRDRDPRRHAMRMQLLAKYPELPDPPGIRAVTAEIGQPAPYSHDWVDVHLLAALRANAVDFLVTEDLPLHQKAKRLGLKHRTLLVAEAVGALHALFDRPTTPPPAVCGRKCHALDLADPIFDSLKADYMGFAEWFERCQKAHRQAWVIYGEGRTRLEAVAIVKRDDDLGVEVGLTGKCLKLCCFKVSSESRGRRYGELLLKTVLMHASENRYDGITVTVFGKYDYLIDFLQDFGFGDSGRLGDHGDRVLAKRLTPPPGALGTMGPWEYHRAYGPFALPLADGRVFIVPIQPRYHCLLFPEAERQLSLCEGAVACGNGIKKAYLCNAGTRQLGAGDSLLFYQSSPTRAVACTGVVEQTLVSRSAPEITRFVGKRTVYGHGDIEQMAHTDVLAILFRQSVTLGRAVAYEELRAAGLLRGVPQTITRIGEGGAQWLSHRIRQ